ncbi:asparagine synthase-related protein [Nocardia suismassiliense]|uniref:Asparagine synthase-related protein n=1 Tax=Nocardia suismassiliense TaxID=2077092 RepID=A0ABW6R0J9_9NOCA
MDHSPLTVDYLGCAGRATLPRAGAPVDYASVPFAALPARSVPESPNYLRQWTKAGKHPNVRPAHPGDRAHLALGGTLTGVLDDALAERITATLRSGRYADLAELPGDLVGCLVTDDRVFLFRSLFTRDTLFYKQSGHTLAWSSDPADLIPDGLDRLDRETIWRICRGDSIFAYPELGMLRPGHLLVFDGVSAEVVQYDRITPKPLPRGSTARDYAERAWELLLAATRPYAHNGHIGLLLSGGMDSSAVAAALVANGADVTAYHLATDDPLADESEYAREVCRYLSIPFVPIMTDTGAGHVNEGWRFSHPYNHTGFRWLEQIVQRVHQDGVELLTWGRDGDLLFSPAPDYGVCDVLQGRLSWSEKRLMLRGLLCSRWTLTDLLKSVRRSYSLAIDASAFGDYTRHPDFLVPMPGVRFELPNPEFVPEEQTTDLALAWPHGVQFCSPMADRALYELMTGMPRAYRCISYGGRNINKPVLRLMLEDRLPPMIWRRHGRLWLGSPHENFCLNHPQALAGLLGPDSLLAGLNIVDPAQVVAVLGHPLSTRRHAQSLICTAMTELFLRSLESRTAHPVRS